VGGKWRRAAALLDMAEGEVDVLKAREVGTKRAGEAQATSRKATEEKKRDAIQRPKGQRPSGGLRDKH